MRDDDITFRHHGGDPLSNAAHANTLGTRVRDLQRIERYIEGRPRGATFAEAMHDLALVRPTATARFSQAQREQIAFPVKLLHRYGLFTGIEAKRPVPGRRMPAQVLMGHQRTRSTYGAAVLSSILAATVKPSRARGRKAPIEQMTDSLWTVYRYVDQCGHNGTTADATQWRLSLDQSNCSTQFAALRKVKAVMPVRQLHRCGAFLATPATRQTRNHQAAAVVVSIGTVLRSDISSDKLNLLMSVAEMDRLERLLCQ